MNKDYVFHINWEDRNKNSYRVGILAELDSSFYLVIKSEKDAILAYKQGFIGIPGIRPQEIYRSQELFDFFKNRILSPSKSNPSEELARSRAVSMIDSFSVDQVPEKVTNKYKEIILKAYELQERKKEVQAEGEIQEIQDNIEKCDLKLLEDIE